MAKLRVNLGRTGDVLRAKQRALECEIAQWAERNIFSVRADPVISQTNAIAEETEKKVRMIYISLKPKTACSCVKLSSQTIDKMNLKPSFWI
jgi:hypothetical protein